MKVPKVKTTPLAPVTPVPVVNAIPEPKRLGQAFIEAGRTLASAYAACRDTVKLVAPDLLGERARFELMIRQRGPDWSFTTTGNRYPVSSQLLRLAEQASYSVLSYISALTTAETLLDDSRTLIERAEAYHNERRELATSVPDLELLEMYFDDFVKMKAERSKLLGLVTIEYLKKLPVELASACVIRMARAATEVGVAYDIAQDTARLKQFRADIDAFRGAHYPVNEKIAALEHTLRPLIPGNKKLILPRQVWPNGDSDVFAPPTLQ